MLVALQCVRKKGLLICHVFSYVAAILFGFCNMAKSFEMLILARLFTGFGCGKLYIVTYGRPIHCPEEMDPT